MKAWISPTAKKLLADPNARRQIEILIGSRKSKGIIKYKNELYKITRSGYLGENKNE